MNDVRLNINSLSYPDYSSGSHAHTLSLLPLELRDWLFSSLSILDVGHCLLTCRAWKQVLSEEAYIDKVLIASVLFGKDQWESYTGLRVAKNIPSLPNNAAAILRSPCPFWKGRRVWQTHTLVLVPGVLNEQPVTLNSLGSALKIPPYAGQAKFEAAKSKAQEKSREQWDALALAYSKQEAAVKSHLGSGFDEVLRPERFISYQEEGGVQKFTDAAIEKPYWLLVTKELPKGSAYLPSKKCKSLTRTVHDGEASNYVRPSSLEIVIALTVQTLLAGSENSIDTILSRDKTKKGNKLGVAYVPSNYYYGRVVPGRFSVSLIEGEDLDNARKRPIFRDLFVRRFDY